MTFRVAVLAVCLGSSVVSNAQVDVTFEGVDRRHIAYSADLSAGGANYSRFSYTIIAPDGRATDMASSGPGGVFEGTYRLTDMVPGMYEIVARTTYSNGAHSDGHLAWMQAGNLIRGRMLYDETFEGLSDVVIGTGLEIPQGRTLTLKNTSQATTSPITSDAGDHYLVSGRLELIDCLMTRGVYLDLPLSGTPQRGTLSAVGTRFEGDIKVQDLTSAEFTTCHFNGPCYFGRVYTTTDGRTHTELVDDLYIADSLFTVGYEVNMGARNSCDIRQNEFYTESQPRLFYYPVAGDAGIVGNVFSQPLRLRLTPLVGSPPEIRGNSFLNEQTLIVVDRDGRDLSTLYYGGLPMPDNYWGGVRGPHHSGPGGEGGWLDSMGGYCIEFIPGTSVSEIAVDRVSHVTAKRPMPQIWVHDFRFGQQVLGQVARQGCDALLSVDVRAAAAALQGVTFHLTCNGQTVPAVNPDFVIRRDYGRPDTSQKNGDRTLNFIIPKSLMNAPPLSIRLEADTTALTEYSTPGVRDLLLMSKTLGAAVAPARNLRVGVVAVDVTLSGYVPTPSTAVGKVISALESDLPAMWPLTPSEITFVNLGRYSYTGGTYYDSYGVIAWLASAGGLGFINNLAWALSDFMSEYNATRPAAAKIDYLVAAAPFGSLGGNEGANLAGRRGVALVDESKPHAAIHELGHALGLYQGKEQYGSWWGGTDNKGNPVVKGKGVRLSGVTVFNPHLAGGSQPAVPNRIRHFPYGTTNEVYDFMGAATPQWVVPSTFADVQTKLSTLLRSTPKTTYAAIPSAASVAPGYRRLCFRGLARLEWFENPYGTPEYRFHLMPQSITCYEDSAGLVDPIRQSSLLHNSFACYTAAGAYINNSSSTFYGPSWDRSIFPEPPDVLPWIQTFDVPDNTRTIKITDSLNGQRILTLTAADSLVLTFTGPPTGTTLGDTVHLAWTGSLTGGSADTPRPHYRLHYATDDRATWTPIGIPSGATSLDLRTADLPASTSLAFRMTLSDGFTNTVRVLGNYTVPNRAPIVTIVSPRPQVTAPPGTRWNLDASAWDPEDGAITAGTWRSSRDGILGSGGNLQDVALTTPGTHTLTFTATDTDGLSGSASVDVSVQTLSTVDLHVDADALSITPATFLDPMTAPPDHPMRGVTNYVTATFCNEGTTNIVRMRLYMTEPDAVERLLAARILSWKPFARETLQVTILPTARGRYSFRATLDPLNIADRDVSNNTHAWSFGNAPPSAQDIACDAYAGQAVALLLTGSDPDGDDLTFTLTSAPLHGVCTGTLPQLKYTAAGGYVGTDQFTFRVSDGVDQATAAVRMNVLPGKAPVITSQRYVRTVNAEPFAYQIAANYGATGYGASGLPAGLSLDPATGLITGRPLGTGTHTVDLSASNAAGTATLRMTLTVEESYTGWAAAHALSGPDGLRNADFDQDGISNLGEYVLGLDPRIPDATGMPVGIFVSGKFALRYRQRTGGYGSPPFDYHVDGVTYVLEACSDPGNPTWASGRTVFNYASSRTSNGDGTETVVVQPKSGNDPRYAPKQFIRFSVREEPHP